MLTASAGAFPGLAEVLSDMSVRLEARPLVSFAPPVDWAPLDTALSQRHSYQAIALTSPRAARALVERMDAGGLVWETTPRVWVVGAATEEALQGRVGPVEMSQPQPGESAALSLARAMLKARVGSPVLFPCGDRRRDELPDLLRRQGVQVNEIVCYRTVLATLEQAREAVSGSTIVIVASPSVAELLAVACPAPMRPHLVAAGTTTAGAAEAAGWPAAAVAAEPSSTALTAAIVGLLATR